MLKRGYFWDGFGTFCVRIAFVLSILHFYTYEKFLWRF